MNNKVIGIVFLSLLLTNFFGATHIPSAILFLVLLPLIVFELNNEGIFKKYIYLLIIGLILSSISSLYYEGQPIFATLRGSSQYLFILFYFALRKINMPLNDIERALVILMSLFIISYLIQYFMYPTVIFSGAEEDFNKNNRLRMAGQGLSSLAIFWGINKYLLSKQKMYLIFIVVGYAIILFMGFRTMIALVIFFNLLLIFKVNGFNRRVLLYGAIIILLFVGVMQVPVFEEKINLMLERQENQTFYNPNYVRVLQFEYYIYNHFEDGIEYFFGSGSPDENSNTRYSNYMYGIASKGLNWTDFGLLSRSWVVGILTVLAMILYSLKAYSLDVYKNYRYLGVWFLYLLSISFTTIEFLRPGNLIVQSIVLYMVEKAHLLRKD